MSTTSVSPGAMPPGNVLIGQSGGPTSVINQSLVGLVEVCRAADSVRKVLGAVHGIQGILDDHLYDAGLTVEFDFAANQFDSRAPAPNTNLRLDWAWRLGHYRSTGLDGARIDSNTILVRLSQTF